MFKKGYLLILLFIISGCGGIEQESTSSGTPKVTTNPTSISYKTQYGDEGSWNSNQVIVSTYSTDTKDNPVEGEVTISYSSSYVKLYDQSGSYIATGSKITTTGGTQTLRVDYYSNGKNNLEYETSIILQFQSSAATLSISVQKPDSVSISIKSSPSTIEDQSQTTDTGTWNSKTVAITLFANTTAISDNVFVFTSGKTEYITVTDTSGNNLSAGTAKTDSSGKALLYVKYYTKKNLEYTASIQVFYGNYSSTTTINITKKKTDVYTTTILPSEYSYNATSDDKGTWRYQNFTISVKDADGAYVENANVNLSVTSEYTYLSINGQDLTNYVATTNSTGTHTVKLKYYTQSTKTKVEYTASLAANEAIATIKVTSDGPGKVTTKVSPSSFQYKADSSDTGTYREEQFSITTTYSDGTPAESASASLSVSSSYTKLLIDGTEYTNYSTKTNTNGYLNVTLRYYTQSTPTKIEYTANLTVNDVSVPITITSAGKETITTTLTPTSYEYKAKSDDAGTWREQVYTIYTKDVNGAAASNKSINLAASSSYTKLKIDGTEYSSYTSNTSSNGYYNLTVKYYTEKGLEYNSTISANEATSTIKVTSETTAKTVTTITPGTFSYKAGSTDAGTWREQSYIIYTKDSSGYAKGSTEINLAVSSPYTKLYIGGSEYTTYSTTTNSSGYYNLTVRYYTKATPTKVEYTSTLMANDATSSITVTAEAPTSTAYSISVSPSSLSYTYSATDAGTWRTQYFVIVVSDSTGSPVSGASLTITSPHSQYSKLNGATDTLINVTTDSSGQYNLKTEYYTEADYSVSPVTKKTWSGYLTITSGTANKQVQFTIN